MSGKAAKRTRGARDGERRRAWPTALLPWAIVAVSVLVSAGVAGAVMLTRTAAGREMVLDWALSRLRPAINGSIRVGSVAPGGLLTGATLHDLEISDSLGRPVLVADSIRARYSVLELLAGTSGVADVHIWSPTLTLDHAPGERVDLSSLLTGTDAAPDAASDRRGEGDAPGFRIRGARIHAGTVTMLDDDGTEKRVDRISAAFGRIDIRPGQGVDLTASLEDVALSYPLGGGRLDLADIQGALEVGAGGISVNTDRFRLPGSEGRGLLLAERRDERWYTTFDLDFSRLSLSDLSWLDERLDSGTARGDVLIRVGPGGVLIDVTDGRVEGDPGRFALSGGVSLGGTTLFRNLRIAPEMLATSELDRWLASPAPVSGALSGDVRFDGEPGRLEISGELALVHEATLDTLAHLVGEGTTLGRRMVDDVDVDVTSLDYTLLRNFVPGVEWDGRGDGSLQVSGALRTGMQVRVVANQTIAGGFRSSVAVSGTLYGDTAVSLIHLDASLSPLSPETIRDVYPDFPLAGAIDGAVSLIGPLEELVVTADLGTLAGALTARATVNVRDPAAGYRLTASAEDFRLSELIDGLPDSTVVSGTANLSGSGFDLGSLRGALAFDAGPSSLGRLRVDSASANLWVDDDGVLHVLSLYGDAGGLVVQGRDGSIGAAPGASGEGIVLAVTSSSIHPLRDLVMGENLFVWDELAPIEQNAMIQFDGVDPDTFPTAREIRFDGSVVGEIRVEGGLDDMTAQVDVDIEGLEYGVNSARLVEIDVTARGVGLPGSDSASSAASPLVLEGTIGGDSIAFEGREFRSARLEGEFDLDAGGPLRAIVVRTGGAALSRSESYEAQAVVNLGDGGGRIDLDRLNLVFDDRRWGLRGPASFEWDRDVLVVNDFGLIRPGAEGLRALADGSLAFGAAESDFELQIRDLDLGIVGSLLQLPRFPAGLATAEVRVTGSGADPEWEGSFQVEDAEYETIRFDRVAAAGRYSGRSVEGGIESWIGGRRTLRVDGTAPIDLRLRAVDARIPDEAVDLDIVADSFPAAIALGFLRSLEEVDGTLTGDVTVGGRRSDLEPDGVFRLENATGLLAPLGVRLSAVDFDMALSPDGTVAVDGSGVSGGTIEVRGTVGAGDPSDVVLDLAFWPREFRLVDRRDMVAAVSGDSITLTGTFNLPFIEGRLDVNGSTVFIEEFQRTAEAVDFYDPVLFSAATAEIGISDEDEESGTGVRERNPFLEHLRVAIDMHVGRGNWLRSRVMNVETAGDLSVTFDRQGNQLILQGEIEVVRGTYSLGPSTLTMTEGTFQFVGTPGFDPGLAVTTERQLRTREGEPLLITAGLSGTLLSPRINLASNATFAMSEADMVTYLVLGRPTSALISEGGAGSVGAGTNLLLSQFFNELGYVLALELGVDHLSVSQAEQSQANAAFGASSLQVEAGWYLVDDVFLTGVYQRGFCADPTLPVSSGGVRVEVEMPKDVKLEGFLEGRCTRERYRGLGDLSLELARIWGFSFFREWGY